MTNYERLKNAIEEIEKKNTSYDKLVDIFQEFTDLDYVTNSYASIVEWLETEREMTWEDVDNLRKALRVVQKANILNLCDRKNCKTEYDLTTHSLLNEMAFLLGDNFK